jgi:hypothetical protein
MSFGCISVVISEVKEKEREVSLVRLLHVTVHEHVFDAKEAMKLASKPHFVPTQVSETRKEKQAYA